MSDKNRKIGEVVNADSAGFRVQCYELHEPPLLGSFLEYHEGTTTIWGVVLTAETSPIDSGRPVMALGAPEESEEELLRKHPELSILFRTDVQALVVGYRENGGVRQGLPPRPARIHGFVSLASPSQVREFTVDLTFIATLISTDVPHRDHALASCLRLASAAHETPRDFLVSAGREVARLLAADAPRLHLLLRQITPA